MSPNKPLAVILIFLGGLALLFGVAALWALLMTAYPAWHTLFFVMNLLTGGFTGWHIMNAFRALR